MRFHPSGDLVDLENGDGGQVGLLFHAQVFSDRAISEIAGRQDGKCQEEKHPDVKPGSRWAIDHVPDFFDWLMGIHGVFICILFPRIGLRV